MAPSRREDNRGDRAIVWLAAGLFFALPAWADFYHSPLLAVKDPYTAVQESTREYRVEIAPQKYPVGGEGEDTELTLKRSRLARLKKARDTLFLKLKEFLRRDATGTVQSPEEGARNWQPSGIYLGRFPLKGVWEIQAERYEEMRAWLEKFPFPAPEAPIEAVDAVPDGRIDDLEKAVEVFPEVAKAHFYQKSLAGYLILAENLVFLDAGNINAREFPNFRAWRDEIPGVLQKIRKVFEEGGIAGAEASVRTLVFLWTSCPEVEQQHRIKARSEVFDDLEKILKKIGPQGGLPPLLGALPMVDGDIRKKLIKVIKMIDKRSPPKKKDERGDIDLEAWIAWYEERWGPWPARPVAVPDLSDVVLRDVPEGQ